MYVTKDRKIWKWSQ